MKTIINLGIIIISLVTISFTSFSGTEKPWCPKGASWRIDRHTPTPSHLTGSWVEISRHKDKEGELTWGQSACYDPGNYCHLNDWFTWWFSSVTPPPKPEPQSEYETIYLPCIPEGYNPASGEYICN